MHHTPTQLVTVSHVRSRVHAGQRFVRVQWNAQTASAVPSPERTHLQAHIQSGGLRYGYPKLCTKQPAGDVRVRVVTRASIICGAVEQTQPRPVGLFNRSKSLGVSYNRTIRDGYAMRHFINTTGSRGGCSEMFAFYYFCHPVCTTRQYNSEYIQQVFRHLRDIE